MFSEDRFAQVRNIAIVSWGSLWVFLVVPALIVHCGKSQRSIFRRLPGIERVGQELGVLAGRARNRR